MNIKIMKIKKIPINTTIGENIIYAIDIICSLEKRKKNALIEGELLKFVQQYKKENSKFNALIKNLKLEQS